MTKFFKVVAVVAVLAAVAVGASADAAYTRYLTVGSQGADVTELQMTLEAQGYLVMPAGVAHGYFGALTKNAVAKWQAAVGLPATGYFGPMSIAKIAATGSTSNGNGNGSTQPGNNNGNGGLQGGEASLESFEFNDEESEGAEGEEEVEVATAEFDVEDADARIERVEVDFQAENAALTERPWEYFDTVYLMADGKTIAEMDVDSRSDWDEDDADDEHDASAADWYRLTFTGLDYVVDEGDTAEITVAVDIAGSIDTADQAQDFTVLIPDEGIRATDAEGIQQYTGDYDETVTDFGFDAEESGDLDIQTNSDDPDQMTLISDEDDESEDYTVFVFDIENNDNADALITDLTLDVATSSGDDINDILDSVTLVIDGDEFDGDINQDGTVDFDDIDVEVGGDDTITVEVVAVIKEDAPESTVDFSIDSNDIDAEGVESGDDADVSGSASSETHIVSALGITVSADDQERPDSNDDDTIGTFSIEFTVSALEDDVYIYNGADLGDGDATPFSEIASTTGFAYNIYRGGTLIATTTDSAVIQSSADTSGSYFLVEEGETETFTLTVTLAPSETSAQLFSVELDAIRFGDDNTTGTADDTVYTVPNDAEFETDPISLQ